jgi:hypothetical protein
MTYPIRTGPTIISRAPVTGGSPARPPALVLLTATVAPPPGVPGLGRTDPSERLDDYARALEFYLGVPDSVVDRIVVADNSDADLGRLEEIVERHGGRKEVELLSFYGLDYPVAYGRAFGETRLIETAFGRSRLLAALGEDDHFWKLTGRLRYINLARLIETAPSAFDLYADFRRLPLHWLDIRGFACTPKAFRALFASRVESLREDRLEDLGLSCPEELLFDELVAERTEWRIVPRLATEPRIEGRSGIDGREYTRPARRLWVGTRAVLRRIVPGLWV